MTGVARPLRSSARRKSRQPNVEHDEVRFGPLELGKRLDPVARLDQTEARLELGAVQPPPGGIIVNDEHGSHAITIPAPPG